MINDLSVHIIIIYLICGPSLMIFILNNFPLEVTSLFFSGDVFFGEN